MARTPNPELQEKLAAVKREQILEAARATFAEKGFHAATIRDVARVAGVADGTIYNHFENKGALLLGLFDLLSSQTRQAVDPAELAGLDLRGFVRLLIRLPLRAFEADNFALFRILISEVMVNPDLAARFREQVLGPITTGADPMLHTWAQQKGASSEQIRLLMQALSSMMLGLVLQRALGDERLDREWDMRPDQLANLLLDGLQPESR